MCPGIRLSLSPKVTKIMSNRILFSFILLVAVIAIGSARVTAQPKVSPDEQKMGEAIAAAPDPAAKLKAAGDLIKKYPKSSLRPMVAQKLADQIHEVADGAQRITLSQDFKSTFNSPAEEEMIMPVLIVGY